MNIGVQFQRCYVQALRVSHTSTSYDVEGRPTHHFRVELQVANNSPAPKGPRVEVTLWDASGFDKSTRAIADSLEGDLLPGQWKTFTDHMAAGFEPAFVSVSEKP